VPEQPTNAAIIALITSLMERMEQRLLNAIQKSPGKVQPVLKPDLQCPFVRQKDAIKLLGTRSTLESCEEAGWITATTRRARLVLYKREEVLAAVYRLAQGEYP
jgi:hypothetical protein